MHFSLLMIKDVILLYIIEVTNGYEPFKYILKYSDFKFLVNEKIELEVLGNAEAIKYTNTNNNKTFVMPIRRHEEAIGDSLVFVILTWYKGTVVEVEY